MKLTPRALLAEVTYDCPLHCPYCSNPVDYPNGELLSGAEWTAVFQQAAELGVLHTGFSGGEPLRRKDLEALIESARANGLYTNLLTSGVGLTSQRAQALRGAGLDSLQLSFQSDDESGDEIAGTRAHLAKLAAASAAREAGLPLSMNVVLHRGNIDRIGAIVAFAESLGANRLELANAQYYGWALLNRNALLPSREQVQMAADAARRAKQAYAGRVEVFYVLPDYYEGRPKPCMQGWGQKYLTVNPVGDVLPCPTATSIPNLVFENVRSRSLREIWESSESFNRFRGTEWMPALCQTCPQRDIDFGGCRCQAAIMTGDPAATDPVCQLSPERWRVDEAITRADGTGWIQRRNPSAAA